SCLALFSVFQQHCARLPCSANFVKRFKQFDVYLWTLIHPHGIELIKITLDHFTIFKRYFLAQCCYRQTITHHAVFERRVVLRLNWRAISGELI
ncbi:MAG: hypothetical protein AAF412_10295, partial [Pseudomonadota bacterium]